MRKITIDLDMIDEFFKMSDEVGSCLPSPVESTLKNLEPVIKKMILDSEIVEDKNAD